MICKKIKERPFHELCDRCNHGKSHPKNKICLDLNSACHAVCEEEFIDIVKGVVDEN